MLQERPMCWFNTYSIQLFFIYLQVEYLPVVSPLDHEKESPVHLADRVRICLSFNIRVEFIFIDIRDIDFRMSTSYMVNKESTGGNKFRWTKLFIIIPITNPSDWNDEMLYHSPLTFSFSKHHLCSIVLSIYGQHIFVGKVLFTCISWTMSLAIITVIHVNICRPGRLWHLL